jgi:hypothetical protein
LNFLAAGGASLNGLIALANSKPGGAPVSGRFGRAPYYCANAKANGAFIALDGRRTALVAAQRSEPRASDAPAITASQWQASAKPPRKCPAVFSQRLPDLAGNIPK